MFLNLQQKVKEWEQYEGEKQKLLQYLKEAEKELEKPAATTGQDLAEKDLKSKKVCLFLFVVFHSWGDIAVAISLNHCISSWEFCYFLFKK